MCSGGLALECRKLVKAGRFWYGQAGTATDSEFCRLWLEAGANVGAWPDDLELDDQSHGIVVRSRTGEAYFIDGKRPVLLQCFSPHIAVGSGSDYALAAMRLGKTAVEAVDFASQSDLFTGNGVDHIDIRKRPKPRAKR
jgi:hypothetical protein